VVDESGALRSWLIPETARRRVTRMREMVLRTTG